MDGSRFDAWTRRRFGLAAGGFAAALLALAGLDVTAKKKRKKKKKRCKKQNAICVLGAKPKCCENFNCGHPLNSTSADFCCLPGGASCSEGTQANCCSGICRTDNNLCFCKDTGQACDSNAQCCSNRCVNGLCT